MEEEKTLAIPLGGSTVDGAQVQPTVGPVESSASGVREPEQKSGKSQSNRQKSAKSIVRSDEETFDVSGGPVFQSDEPKKPSAVGKAVKAFGALIIFLLVVVVIGGAILFVLATRDELPSAPEIKTDMKTVATDSAWEAIREREIRLNSDEINLFLSTVKEKSAEKMARIVPFLFLEFTSLLLYDSFDFFYSNPEEPPTWKNQSISKSAFVNCVSDRILRSCSLPKN